MGKFDAIDIVFISLISFYLLVFTLIFILLLRKYHGIKGFYNFLLDKNEVKESALATSSLSGNGEENKDAKVSSTNNAIDWNIDLDKYEKTLEDLTKKDLKPKFNKIKSLIEKIKKLFKKETKKITKSSNKKTTTKKSSTKKTNSKSAKKATNKTNKKKAAQKKAATKTKKKIAATTKKKQNAAKKKTSKKSTSKKKTSKSKK